MEVVEVVPAAVAQVESAQPVLDRVAEEPRVATGLKAEAVDTRDRRCLEAVETNRVVREQRAGLVVLETEIPKATITTRPLVPRQQKDADSRKTVAQKGRPPVLQQAIEGNRKPREHKELRLELLLRTAIRRMLLVPKALPRGQQPQIETRPNTPAQKVPLRVLRPLIAIPRTLLALKRAAIGAAAANRNQPAMTGAEGAAAGTAAVRNSFDHPELYGQQWHGDHPGAWNANGWVAGAAWRSTGWGAVAGLCGYANAPVAYNYGGNVTCLNGNVQVDGQDVGTAEEFSQQAADLAQTGGEAETPSTDEWLPLGVFALVRNEQQHPHLILQLAINKQGTLRGNYTDEVTDHTQPIQGAVDKSTQRAAWTVGDNTSSVMEAGLSNLTQDEAPALLHKNGKTERWLLVRLKQPENS